MREQQKTPRGPLEFWHLAIIVLAALGLTAGGFWAARRAQLNAFEVRFQNDSATRTAMVQRQLDEGLVMVKALGHFVQEGGGMDAARFQGFIEPLLAEQEASLALEWAPRVSLAERAVFERRVREHEIYNFHFTEQDHEGGLVPASERDTYYPVLYVQPLLGNETVAGFDLGSEPVRRAALERARDTGQPTVAERIGLVQEQGEEPGFLVFVPVYREGMLTGTVAERRLALAGFGVGVFRAEAVVSAALRPSPLAGLSLELLDASATPPQRLFYYLEAPATSRLHLSLFSPPAPRAERTFSFTDRDWKVAFTASPRYLQQHCPTAYWLVIPWGLLLTALLALYLWTVLRARDRMERLIAERTAALRESEERSRAVVENSPIGIGVSVNDRLVYMNPAGLRVAGVADPAKLLGHSIPEFVHEDFRAESERRRRRMEETGLPAPVVEGKLRRPDGKVLDAEWMGVPIVYGGQPAILHSFRDITERTQAAGALKASEAKDRQLHESMMDAFASVDMQGRLNDFNEVFRSMLGYQKEELAALTYRDLTPEKWHAFEAEIIAKQVLVRGYSDIYEKEYRRKDGTTFPIELRAVLLRNRAGEPCGIWAVVRDISQRKWAEGVLAGEKRVLESIARGTPLPEVLDEICGFIADLSPGVMPSILLCDPEGKQLWPAASRKLPEDWVRSITPLAVGPATGSCGAATARRELVVATDIARDPLWTAYPAALERALNSGLRSCWSMPIFSADGGVFGTFAMYYGEPRSPQPAELEVIKQVSHLASVAIEHERTAELVRANERLEELDRLKSQFLATMSHELRTPLNSIIGFTGILRQGFAGTVNAEQKKQLDLVFDSAKHLLSLINDLLDLSRIEAGKADLDRKPFNFAEVVTEVAQNLTLMAGQKNLRLVTHLSSPTLEMVGDRKRSFQVLLNLANNAVKFTNQGQVEISAGPENGHLRVSVADTGIGIRPDQMGLLFEAFRQLDGSARRVYEGTGLGLYLCRKLLALMHGEITVESEPGEGSRFTFTLPLQLPDLPDSRLAAAGR